MEGLWMEGGEKVYRRSRCRACWVWSVWGVTRQWRWTQKLRETSGLRDRGSADSKECFGLRRKVGGTQVPMQEHLPHTIPLTTCQCLYSTFQGEPKCPSSDFPALPQRIMGFSYLLHSVTLVPLFSIYTVLPDLKPSPWIPPFPGFWDVVHSSLSRYLMQHLA